MTYIPFSIDRWLTWNDVERCPYIWTDLGYYKWIEADDKRMLLIALDRYADYLQKKGK